ncbi:hypothetical protein NDU88_001397 [Pleurodeles waltl]|uniref:Uncharacterized protein n=1 Tax=Pleurodeles waltl TaxID=8319 RepID=A0AAV7S9P1_PLEWA|nr:hypothetical protein NDU88_001397 [Pleurodeles waltl]
MKRDPLLCKIMSDIQSLRGSLELKLDAVTVDINLLRADLQKVTDTVTTAETQTHGLQVATKRLEDQAKVITKQQSAVAAKLEYQEGQAPTTISSDPKKDGLRSNRPRQRTVIRGQTRALIGCKKKEKKLQFEVLERDIRVLMDCLPKDTCPELRHSLQAKQVERRE